MSNVSALNEASEGSKSNKKEFLSFVLGNEQYALDIMSVQEIRGYDSVTKIANTPAFIKGVLNLRGDIVPIVDLRIKFSVGEAIYDEFTIVIMLKVHERIVGIVVDSVSDVIQLSNDELLPPPEFGTSFDTEFLQGLAEVNNEMVIVVNIENLIGSESLALSDPKQVTE